MQEEIDGDVGTFFTKTESRDQLILEKSISELRDAEGAQTTMSKGRNHSFTGFAVYAAFPHN